MKNEKKTNYQWCSCLAYALFPKTCGPIRESEVTICICLQGDNQIIGRSSGIASISETSQLQLGHSRSYQLIDVSCLA